MAIEKITLGIPSNLGELTTPALVALSATLDGLGKAIIPPAKEIIRAAAPMGGMVMGNRGRTASVSKPGAPVTKTDWKAVAAILSAMVPAEVVEKAIEANTTTTTTAQRVTFK